MTNDPLSFIDEAPAKETPEAPKTPEPVTIEPAPATSEPARDAQGRFSAAKDPVAEAPKAPDPAPQAAPPPAPATPEPVKTQEHTVPLATYLEAFNGHRDLKRENARLRQQLEAKTAPPPQLPDPIQDPDGYRAA